MRLIDADVLLQWMSRETYYAGPECEDLREHLRTLPAIETLHHLAVSPNDGRWSCSCEPGEPIHEERTGSWITHAKAVGARGEAVRVAAY